MIVNSHWVRQTEKDILAVIWPKIFKTHWIWIKDILRLFKAFYWENVF